MFKLITQQMRQVTQTVVRRQMRTTPAILTTKQTPDRSINRCYQGLARMGKQIARGWRRRYRFQFKMFGGSCVKKKICEFIVQ